MRDYSNQTTRRADARDVTITDIETAVIEGNFDWNLVRIHTDAGVTGLGESYRGGTVTDIMAYMADFLVGENPLDVERLFRRMVQETSGHGGTTGKVVTAASGIEIALWDLAGKLLDVPTYQLLGGKYRDDVRIYCDLHAGEAYAVDTGYTEYGEAESYQPDAYAETAAAAVEMGFDAIKFDLDTPTDNDPDPFNGRLSAADVAAKRDIVERVHETVGDDAEVAFDCHWDYSIDSAKRLARALEPYDLLWLEDVLPPENVDAQREVARSTSTPLATGENRFRVHEFSDLLYDFAVDVVTPDPTTCGGLAESRAIANRAEENYITFSPHNVCSPVGTMACVHLGASVANFGYLEYHALEVDWWDDLLVRDDPLIQDGRIAVPETPGLGVELDEDVAAEHAKGDSLWT
ncbi:mandelate racemase/muconate lactonizing enzyme family protein [Haloplanus aerogenes]|uniref:L-alanine-DL-glutamate epimerase-like enolase superfamily enzyme n=1 Tax=Haloplanus aerogenes TaxID=660522 RepID=A0A3M0D8N4_9EURY|nr:mandelate racemase/muconate lactonizing enzyme family protein [Haloplanus aerogenes]AZH26394.1 mandelate racemase/muconate lactonizing enzyme family protein [Haloplanus aerogenes]RMB18141.1 L-alanine-DL-glutamate epimerase-like enolase superfamily enzyme [Haloplanus aerogenes]